MSCVCFVEATFFIVEAAQCRIDPLLETENKFSGFSWLVYSPSDNFNIRGFYKSVYEVPEWWSARVGNCNLKGTHGLGG